MSEEQRLGNVARRALKASRQPRSRALPRRFFARDALVVAQELLGHELVLRRRGIVCRALIVETEAYRGITDRACHTFGGRRTPRTETMWGDPGHAYIYFTYGMHWCLNAVCAAAGDPQAVLIRAVIPIAGVESMRRRRGRNVRIEDLCRGPARLCAAFGLTGRDDGRDLTGGILMIERGRTPQRGPLRAGPRIGVDYAGPDAKKPWRFGIGTVHSRPF